MKKEMKWLKRGAAFVLSAFLLMGSVMTASAEGLAKKDDGELKIATLSDTHYLSPDLIKDTEDFTTHLNSDRKMFAESDAILTALLETIRQDAPDVLLISGDLTKDGEKEAHEDLAQKLGELKEQIPGLKIYITPGNHDLNNSNAMNFNTQSGEAEPAGRTSQQIYKDIYAELVYDDESIIAEFQPAAGNQGGGLSYAARPKDGFTIISIDSARYSADNTESGTDEHETSGAISADLEKWVLGQITEAKKRGDTVIGLQHHGVIPHFSMEPELLPMYLVNDYERISREFADAGMQYIFTGHMHANDIATLTTESGNTLYDIETGSVVTYPSPVRFVTIKRNIENGTVSETMDVKTVTNVGPITFTNPVTGQQQTIDDISAYGKEHGFSNDMLSTTVNGFLSDYYSQIAQTGSKAAIEKLINDLLADSLPGDGNMTIEKLIDVALPLLLPDANSGEDIYYDSSKGGIAISYPVISTIKLNVLIPNTGLKDTLNVLFEKLDSEVLQDTSQLDAVLSQLVSKLTAIELTEDGKTLLDYANYIYQSHLGGEDSAAFPEWVQKSTDAIESGEALAKVLDVVISELADLLDNVLANVTFEEFVGSSEWDHVNKCFVPYKDGRTPLIQENDGNGGNIASVLGPLGAKWKTESSEGSIVKYTAPAGTINPEKGYTLYDFIYSIRLLGFDMHEFLSGLLIGTPAEPEEGTEATEGLITNELKGQLNAWLQSVVNSMGKDSNYAQDNNTTIQYSWKLLTNRTALDKAIESAQKIDLSKYTEETASALMQALEAARSLSKTASQAQMDEAATLLNDAIDSLKPIADGETGGDNSEDENDANEPNKPQEVEDNDNPKTGDYSKLPLMLAISGSALLFLIVLAIYFRKKTVKEK